MRRAAERRTHQTPMFMYTIFTAPLYASAVAYAIVLCLSVCLSLYLSQFVKRPNVGSRKQRYTIDQGLEFSETKDLSQIRTQSPLTGAPNAKGINKNRRISTNNLL